MNYLFAPRTREVQDLKSAIEDQTRNYRDLQVNIQCFVYFENCCKFYAQAASEKVLTDNRDFKSMQEKKNEEARQKIAAVNALREEIQVGLLIYLCNLL